jgi:tRNA 2-thiouridine synthesizing protein A
MGNTMKSDITSRSKLSTVSWSQPGAAADEEPAPHANAVLEMLQTADTPGTTCAVLTPAIKARLRELAGGQVLEVRVDDPGAHEDIAAWCRLAGHELLAVLDEMPKYTRYFLRKKHS